MLTMADVFTSRLILQQQQEPPNLSGSAAPPRGWELASQLLSRVGVPAPGQWFPGVPRLRGDPLFSSKVVTAGADEGNRSHFQIKSADMNISIGVERSREPL